MEGWIKIQRKIVKHWIWSNAKYLQGWVYILYRANYEDKKVLVGATLMPLKRGTFITSLNKFSIATHMSIQEARTFLNLLEGDEMINIETTSRLTQITVCNYELYQDEQHTSNTPTTNQQQTSNNREEVKEVKEVKENLLKESSKVDPRSVRIKKAVEQYKVWREESNWDLYKAFITWMLDENLEACFSLTDQFSEKKFRDLMKRHNAKSNMIKNKISAMENSKGLEKNNKSFSRTLNGWIARETNR